jgi:hypothetical protein
VSVQAATVVKFFAADILPAVGRHAEVVEDGLEKVERCLLEAKDSTENERPGRHDRPALPPLIQEHGVRERALIHVAGPPGSGKTTFIEAILRAAGLDRYSWRDASGTMAPAGAGDSAQESSGAPAV